MQGSLVRFIFHSVRYHTTLCCITVPGHFWRHVYQDFIRRHGCHMTGRTSWFHVVVSCRVAAESSWFYVIISWHMAAGNSCFFQLVVSFHHMASDRFVHLVWNYIKTFLTTRDRRVFLVFRYRVPACSRTPVSPRSHVPCILGKRALRNANFYRNAEQ